MVFVLTSGMSVTVATWKFVVVVYVASLTSDGMKMGVDVMAEEEVILLKSWNRT